MYFNVLTQKGSLIITDISVDWCKLSLDIFVPLKGRQFLEIYNQWQPKNETNFI